MFEAYIMYGEYILKMYKMMNTRVDMIYTIHTKIRRSEHLSTVLVYIVRLKGGGSVQKQRYDSTGGVGGSGLPIQKTRF